MTRSRRLASREGKCRLTPARLLTLLLAAVAVILVVYNTVRNQRTAVRKKATAVVTRLGGSVRLSSQSRSSGSTRTGPGLLPEGLRFPIQGDYVEVVNLTGAKKVTDADLRELADMLPLLRELHLGLTPITDAGLAALEGLSHLECLDLTATEISDAGLVHLESLGELRTLDLALNAAVTDEALRHLARLNSLESLVLGRTAVTGRGFQELGSLPTLKRLDLDGTPFTDKGLVHLSRLTTLEILDLHQTLVTNAGVKHLSALRNLVYLDLSRTGVGDNGVAELRQLRNLELLDLSETHVTDAGLAHLNDLTSLRNLLLAGTPVTDRGLAQLTNVETLPCVLLLLHRSWLLWYRSAVVGTGW